MAMLVYDRGLRTDATQGRTRRENQLKILVCFLVAEDTFGDLQQAAEFDQRRYARSGRGFKRLLAAPTKAKGTKARLVGNTEQIVDLAEGSNGTLLALRLPALRALHDPAAPG